VYSVLDGGWILMDKMNGLDMLKEEALGYICDWESHIRDKCTPAQQDKWFKMVRDAQGNPQKEKEIRKAIEFVILNNQ
jgi:hypothetical protein